jgi:hypothetical protein
MVLQDTNLALILGNDTYRNEMHNDYQPWTPIKFKRSKANGIRSGGIQIF